MLPGAADPLSLFKGSGKLAEDIAELKCNSISKGSFVTTADILLYCMHLMGDKQNVHSFWEHYELHEPR